MKIECTPAERAVIENALAIILCNDCTEAIRKDCKESGKKCHNKIEWVEVGKSISVPIEYNIGDKAWISVEPVIEYGDGYKRAIGWDAVEAEVMKIRIDNCYVRKGGSINTEAMTVVYDMKFKYD